MILTQRRQNVFSFGTVDERLAAALAWLHEQKLPKATWLTAFCAIAFAVSGRLGETTLPLSIEAFISLALECYQQILKTMIFNQALLH